MSKGNNGSTTGPTGLSRRSFLQGGALVAAGVATAALAGCGADTEARQPGVAPSYVASEPESWDKEADMVILGCGIAGACAAVEAHDLGLSVLVVEALDDIKKCSCTLSGGWLCGVNTELQEIDGIEDDIEIFIKDVRRCGGDFGDPDVIRAWGEISGETVDWLEELGCDVVQRTFDAKTAGSNSHSIARDYMTNPIGNGLGWMVGLEGAINERGIEVLYETRATTLCRNEAGRVVGAQVATKDGQTLNVKGTRGVLVSTGGIGGNIDMWATYAPAMRVIKEEAKTVLSAAPQTCMGDGLAMIHAVNGYIYPTLANYGGGGVVVDPNEPANAILLPYVWSDNLIEVSSEGKRFNNESDFSEYFSERPYQDIPGMWHVVVFDDAARQSADGQAHAQPIIDDAAANNITDTVVSADSIEELAEAFGIPAQGLKKTIDEFNGYVESGGPDPFGRVLFDRKIETPPFWGIEQDIVVATSKGGAKINPRSQVLDRDGEVIPGLYAAGEAAFFPDPRKRVGAYRRRLQQLFGLHGAHRGAQRRRGSGVGASAKRAKTGDDGAGPAGFLAGPALFTPGTEDVSVSPRPRRGNGAPGRPPHVLSWYASDAKGGFCGHTSPSVLLFRVREPQLLQERDRSVRFPAGAQAGHAEPGAGDRPDAVQERSQQARCDIGRQPFVRVGAARAAVLRRARARCRGHEGERRF